MPEFPFPLEPTVLFLFNPFSEAGLRRMIEGLERSVREHPRAVYVVYHNPVLGRVLDENVGLKKITGTHQFAIYQATVWNSHES
jgi:hypothetical protein